MSKKVKVIFNTKVVNEETGTTIEYETSEEHDVNSENGQALKRYGLDLSKQKGEDPSES